MNRLSKKEILLKELDSIKNAVKQASFDINKSVLSVLRDRLKPLSGSKEKGTIIKRTRSYNMTELCAVAQNEATQQANLFNFKYDFVRKIYGIVAKERLKEDLKVCRLYESGKYEDGRVFQRIEVGKKARNGFCDWKNAASRIQSHENSIAHRNATITFSQRVQVRGCVDSAIVEQYRQECAYAKSVLERVVSVIKFLAERGLAFRGHTEILGSSSNGNFLGILGLIAQFDPFLSSHIDNHGGMGKGSVSYLSSTICDELIDVMGKQVMKTILSEIRGAKFYSISVDSTPDISHVDRLSCVFRYVLNDGPIERFVQFLSMKGHGAEDLFNSLYSFLEEAKLDIKYCRGQSYDNASNMAGKYSGLQTRIREKNPLAEYVPCFAHSLNLVGASAVNCVTTVSGFFDFVQNLYVFLNASTQRWELLTKGLDSNQLVLKRLSDTRWSAHSAATKALSKGFKNVKTVLENIAEDPRGEG
nr:zinc finger MYM-type protein 1-like [Hydra vulgaris]